MSALPQKQQPHDSGNRDRIAEIDGYLALAAQDCDRAIWWLDQALALARAKGSPRPELVDALSLEVGQLRGVLAAIKQELGPQL